MLTLMPWKVLKYLSGLASNLANSLARSGHTYEYISFTRFATSKESYTGEKEKKHIVKIEN